MPRSATAPTALRILQAAAEEFARHGLAGGRVARIAERAAANKQLLFYYFHSKEGLHAAAVEWAAERLGELLQDVQLTAPTPEGRLRELLVAQFDLMASQPALAALLGREAAVVEGPRGTLAPAISRLVAVIAEGQGRGAFRDDLDPHVLAAQALILTLGYIQLEPVLAASAIPLGGDGLSLEDRWREALVRLVLRGAATAARP